MKNDFGSDRRRITKLTGPNYPTWKIQMQQRLMGQGLWDTVESPLDSTIKSAGDLDPATTESKASKASQRDAKACLYIINACGPEPFDLICDLRTAHELWARLKRLYAPTGRVYLGQKLAEFYAMTAPETHSVSQIAANLDRLQEEIGDISTESRPSMDMKALVLVETLRRKAGGQYDTIIFHVESEDYNDYDKLVAHFVNIERRLQASKAHRKAMLSAETQNPGGKSGSGQGRGTPNGRFNGECYYCKKTGHVKANCRARKAAEGLAAGK